MKTRLILSSVLVCGLVLTASHAQNSPESDGLKPVSEFAGIEDRSERARALFAEAGKVLLHPRCINCHPAGESPLQGEDGEMHQPWVRRGPSGRGVAGMRCHTCHGRENFEGAGVPGAPHWSLAPANMAWEGLTLGQLCQQLKDPARNGGRMLEDVVHHMSEDALVAWAWKPGGTRQPAPGTQVLFGELIEAWAKNGASCPEDPGSTSGDQVSGPTPP